MVGRWILADLREDCAVLQKCLDEYGLEFEPMFVGVFCKCQTPTGFEILLQGCLGQRDESFKQRDAFIQIPLSISYILYFWNAAARL